MNHSLIKTLNLNDYLNDRSKEKFIQDIASILSDTGFFFLEHHQIPDELIRRYSVVSDQFFILRSNCLM